MVLEILSSSLQSLDLGRSMFGCHYVITGHSGTAAIAAQPKPSSVRRRSPSNATYTATRDNDSDDFPWVPGPLMLFLAYWPQQPHTGDILLGLWAEIHLVWQKSVNGMLVWPRASLARNSIYSGSSSAPSEPGLCAFRLVRRPNLSPCGFQLRVGAAL